MSCFLVVSKTEFNDHLSCTELIRGILFCHVELYRITSRFTMTGYTVMTNFFTACGNAICILNTLGNVILAHDLKKKKT